MIEKLSEIRYQLDYLLDGPNTEWIKLPYIVIFDCGLGWINQIVG